MLHLLKLFFLLVAGHALCDYPLQGDFLSKGKNRLNPLPGVPWYQCMAAHALIHSLMVLLITRSWVCSIVELCLHFAIDDSKCAGNFSYNEDQIWHVTCKAFYVLLIGIGPHK